MKKLPLWQQSQVSKHPEADAIGVFALASPKLSKLSPGVNGVVSVVSEVVNDHTSDLPIDT